MSILDRPIDGGALQPVVIVGSVDSVGNIIVGSGSVGSSAVGSSADGSITDAAAASNVVEDTTAKTGIGLWKGIKNLLKLINDKLVTGTVIGDVNLGATDNAVLDSAVTALQVIDNMISGSEAQVDVVAALPSGTNLLGKVGIDQSTANANEVVLKAGTALAGKVGIDQSTANANEVVVKSGTVTTVSTVSAVTAVGTITPGVAATNLGKAEDAAHTSGDVGVMALAVRADTLAPTGANGDYVPLLVDANGALWVSLGTKLDPVNDSIMPYALAASFISAVTAKIEVDTVIALFASAGGSLRNYVTSLLVTNSDATVGTLVEIRDGTTTVLWRGYAAPAGGGFACTFPVPLKGTAATAINVYCMTASAEVYISGAGYTAL